MTKATLDERLSKVCDWAEARMAKDAAEEEEKKKDEEAKAEDEAKRVKGIDEEEKKKEEESAEDEEEEKKEEKKDGMDSALRAEFAEFRKNGFKSLVSEISARDELAKKLSTHIGAFDCADKSLSEVAEYGVEKLGITCLKGSEKAALDGYLHARSTTKDGFALDSKKSINGKLNAFINSNK